MQKVKLNNHKQRPAKLLTIRDLPKLHKKHAAKGKKIVFTLGSFEFVHPGQCRYLAEAKALGDVLVVGIASDRSEAETKGSDYPLVNEKIRAEMVSFLKVVDYVIITDEVNPYDVLLLLKPDVFFTSKHTWESGVRGKSDEEIIKTFGGKIVKRARQMPYFTLENLAEHIANIRVIQILEKYLKGRVQSFSINPASDLKPADFGDQTPVHKSAFNPVSAVIAFDKLAELGEKLRKKKKKVVFVSGSYDLLHVGHARFIEQAGMLGDVLVVGIPSDEVLRYTKGVGRPIITQFSRALVLGHLDPVDYVTVFDGGPVLGCLESLKPDVFFTIDEEWNQGYKESPEYKCVAGYGGKVARVKRQAPFLSASAMIDKVALKKVREIFRECMDEEKYKNILAEKSTLTASSL